MITTIDKAGRVVIPAEVRKRLGLTAGAELEMVIEGFAIRLVRAVAGPEPPLGHPHSRLEDFEHGCVETLTMGAAQALQTTANLLGNATDGELSGHAAA